MSCCHYQPTGDGLDTAFTVDASRVTFGRGCLEELGDRARALGMTRVALFSDAVVAELEVFDTAQRSLRAAGIDVVTYTEVQVEPTDESFTQAAEFASQTEPDGYVSVGGGSVIDTAKAANLYASYPADFLSYVNPPVGDGTPVPGPLKPHIACPTTSGTGSEVTGIAIFDLLSMAAKTGIASPALRPTEALVDPDCTDTLPGRVVACSGLDVLSHALESFTARPFVRRSAPPRPGLRPMSQGANPWSDLGSREALRLLGQYLERAVSDASDREAREQTMWAATLAGIAFGNAGVHIPHAMAYAVAGQVRDFHPDGYPGSEPLVPHGMSVILNAPSVFRFTASTNPRTPYRSRPSPRRRRQRRRPRGRGHGPRRGPRSNHARSGHAQWVVGGGLRRSRTAPPWPTARGLNSVSCKTRRSRAISRCWQGCFRAPSAIGEQVR